MEHRCNRKTGAWVAASLAVAMLLCACGSTVNVAAKAGGTAIPTRVSAETVIAQTDMAALQETLHIREPEASGDKTYTDAGITIDYSNAAEGYVMLRAKADCKLRISKDDMRYTYDLPAGEWYTYPLSEGSGTYELRLLEQVEGTTYTVLFAKEVKADIVEETRPFLYPSRYVYYTAQSRAVLWSAALCEYAGAKAPSEVLPLLYDYVAENLEYDYDKAATVQSGYLPDVDDTLSTQTGICFDYAALLAAMLRTRDVPTKLVTGYVSPEDMYHAWNLAYVDGEWVWMDATLAAENRRQTDYTEDKRY